MQATMPDEGGAAFSFSSTKEAGLEVSPLGGVSKLEHDDVVSLGGMPDGWLSGRVMEITEYHDHTGSPCTDSQFFQSFAEIGAFRMFI